MIRTLAATMLAALLAGCAWADSPRIQAVVFLAPEDAPPQFIHLTEEDAANETLGRLVREIRRADGARSEFTLSTEESEAMMQELVTRWRAEHGPLMGTFPVVHHEGRYYRVLTAVMH